MAKLVRDKIPQIIEASGGHPAMRVADDAEYRVRLNAKLREEVEEFLASDGGPEELADILEVVYTLAEVAGVSRVRLERIREDKARDHGGFEGRLVWLGNQ